MRLAISNIAWDVEEDQAVAELLARNQIDAIDIAPGKYFPKPGEATAADMRRVKTWWADRGIEITGMQALLFGTTGLNVFGDTQSRETLLEHLAGVARIGAGIGATRIVFGSPKNRDREGLSDDTTRQMAKDFFGQLGDMAASEGVIFCLEPNPECYGANFMVNSNETADVVRFIDHPAIRMQLDTGALTINQEDPAAVLSEHAELIGHVHASEPQLLPLGDGDTDHQAASVALQRYLPAHLVTIEMVATRDEPHIQSIERALAAAIAAYRNGADAP